MSIANIINPKMPVPTEHGGVYGITWDNSRELLLSLGFRIMTEQPAIPAGYTRVSIVAIEGDGINGQWQVEDRLTSAIEAELVQADLVANGDRYSLQNGYLSLCDQLTGSASHVKLGFDELQAIVKGLMATDPNTAVALSLQLLTLNAALVRGGGVNWWDNCEWRELP